MNPKKLIKIKLYDISEIDDDIYLPSEHNNLPYIGFLCDHVINKQKFNNWKSGLSGYGRSILNVKVNILKINPKDHPEYYI